MTRPDQITVLPATPERWPQLEAFFGPNGAYSNCWCAFFRVTAKQFDAGCHAGGEENHALLRRLTLEGAVPGLLAYEADQPVGWVSVAPREQYVRVRNSRLLRSPDPDPDDGVWSVVCFWTPKERRRQGIGDRLLRGALDHAYANGATAVEGYPVDVSRKWTGASSIYHGTVGQFERAGFTLIRRPSDTRAVMRHEKPRKTARAKT
ncbi:MAG TPA: GNAT family N-acetyltransferase [Acidothermaceae bacterium]|jgi:GNAT superfamily N-acetyltransferase